jgi:hypothetical protein
VADLPPGWRHGDRPARIGGEPRDRSQVLVRVRSRLQLTSRRVPPLGTETIMRTAASKSFPFLPSCQSRTWRHTQLMSCPFSSPSDLKKEKKHPCFMSGKRTRASGGTSHGTGARRHRKHPTTRIFDRSRHMEATPSSSWALVHTNLLKV